MILSNIAIHHAIDAGRLVITPEPLPRLPSDGQSMNRSKLHADGAPL